MMKKKKFEISRINILCCLLVIWIHVNSEPVTLLDRNSVAWNVLFILWKAASFVVPCFIFLSALKLFLSPRPTDYRRFYKGRWQQVYAPYLLCAAIYYVYFHIFGYAGYSFTPTDVLPKLFWGKIVGPFYFIVIITQFYLTLPLWKWLVKKVPAWASLLGSAVITHLSSRCLPRLIALLGWQDFPYNDRMMTTYLIYWVAGALCGKHYEAVTEFLRRHRGAVIGIFILTAFVNIGGAWCSHQGIICPFTPFLNTTHLLYCLTAITFLLIAAERERPLNYLETLMDQSSFPIYLWHCLAIYAVNSLMPIGMNHLLWRFGVRTTVTYALTLGVCLGYRHVRTHQLKKAEKHLNI